MTSHMVRDLELFDDEEATGVIFGVDPPEGEERWREIACFRAWNRERGRSKKERGPQLNVDDRVMPILSIEISDAGRLVVIRAVSRSLELDLTSESVSSDEERLIWMRLALGAIAVGSRCEVIDHDGTPTPPEDRDDAEDRAHLTPEDRELFDIMKPVVEAEDPQEDLLEALPKLEALIAREPRFMAAKVALGAVLTELGRHEEALPHLLTAGKAMTADTADSAALGILTEALDALDRDEEAIPWHEKRLQLFPGEIPPIQDYFATLTQLDRDEEILSECDRLETPALRDFLFMARGEALLRLGRFDDAIGWYRKYEKEHPDDPAIHLNLGQAYLQRGDLPRTRKSCARAEELLSMQGAAASLPLLVLLGVVWKGIGDTASLKRIAKTVRQFDPEMAEVLLR